MSKRAVIFIAVSSDRQGAKDKISLELQEQLTRQWCAENDYDVIKVLRVVFSRSDPDIIDLFEAQSAQGITAYQDLRQLWKINEKYGVAQGFHMLVAHSEERLGRSGTLINYVIENTIASRAGIYLINGGEIKPNEALWKAAISTVSVKSHMQAFQAKAHAAKIRRVEKGFPWTAPPFSHKVLKNDKGDDVAFVVDEAKRDLFDHIADLLLEGVAWNRMGVELFQRWHHTNPNYKPRRPSKRTKRPATAIREPYFSERTIYSWIYNPIIWGHLWTWVDDAPPPRLLPMGRAARWIYDESETIPEKYRTALTMYRNSCPAVYTGEQAEKVKAALRQREEFRGSANDPTNALYNNHTYTSIVYCGECGYKLAGHLVKTTTRKKGTYDYIYYTCDSRSLAKRTQPFRPSCSQRGTLVKTRLDDFVRRLLLELVSDDDLALLRPHDDQSRETTMLAIANEIDDLHKRLDALVSQMETLTGAAHAAITKRVQALGEEIDSRQTRLNTLQQAQASRLQILDSQRAALADIREAGIEILLQSPGEMNRLLRQVLGAARIELKDRELRLVI